MDHACPNELLGVSSFGRGGLAHSKYIAPDVATAMYYTGLDPFTMKPVYTATDLREKKMMKALLFYWDPPSWPLAREALRKAGRTDLIGRGERCLVPPEHAGRAHASGRSS